MPTKKTPAPPPGGLPVYRVLTGPDDAKFCHRVSEALSLGYRLYGSPSLTFNGKNVIVAQAIVWPSAPVMRHSEAGPYDPTATLTKKGTP